MTEEFNTADDGWRDAPVNPACVGDAEWERERMGSAQRACVIFPQRKQRGRTQGSEANVNYLESLLLLTQSEISQARLNHSAVVAAVNGIE